MLRHPVALAALAVVAFAAVRIAADSKALAGRITALRLASGLACVAFMAALLAAKSSYLSPEEALRFGVSAENYARALALEFSMQATIAIYVAVVGCSLVGIPVTVWLESRGRATAPALVALSVAISAVTVATLGALSGISLNHILAALPLFAGAHALLALAFAVGAKLPWRQLSNEA